MIAPAVPATTGNGLAMRLGVFLEALSRVAETDLVVVPVAGGIGELPALADRLGVATRSVPIIGRADTHFMLLSRIIDAGARLAAFRAYGRGSLAAFLSVEVLAELKAAVAGTDYDLVHVGRAYLAEAGLAIGGKCLSLDIDEDDATAHASMAVIARRRGRHDAAGWALAEAAAAERLLGRTWPIFSATFIAGAWEGAALRARHAGIRPEVVPNCTPMVARPDRRDDGRTVLFVGSYGHAPNVDGIDRFVRRVWPSVCARSARMPRLLLAGRDPPAAVLALGGRAGVTVLGPVDSVAEVYARATVAIAPLRAGGGTRIKVIEAAAHGVPMVATSLAARDIFPGRFDWGWVADDESGLTEALLAALADRSERRRRAALARAFVRSTHDRQAVVDRLAARLASLMTG